MSTQSKGIAFMADPASHGAGVARVDRYDTHISHIFLAGEFAYKMKRDVVFSFLDFSTLAKRHEACLNELRVNRRWAPQLYLGLSAIVKQPDGHLRLAEAPIADLAVVVEWLVRMRRFADEDLYSARARAGLISREDAVELADMVRALHQASPVCSDDDAFSGLSHVHMENLSFFEAHPELENGGPVLDILAECGRRLENSRLELAERSKRGFRRHCHGDLHLGNIVRFQGRPIAFDGIEFNDQIARIDVLYDLAFLIMDLWRCGLRAEASALLNRYLGAGRESLTGMSGLRLLPLFLALRALIRLMAAVLRSEEAQQARQADAPTAAELSGELSTYLGFASECLKNAPCLLVAIGGLSGTGKTSAAREVAPFVGPVPGAIHLRSDVERKAWFGCEETTRLPPSAYSEQVSEQIYDLLLRKARAVLETGYSVIFDAVSAHPRQRAAIEAVARQLGVPFFGFWLEAPETVMLKRVEQRRADASDANPAVVQRQLSYDVGKVEWKRIDASGGVTSTSSAILDRLAHRASDAS